MTTIDLNRVRTLVAVVEHGSFTGAARELGLPKSSVSRSVSGLERDLGVVLLQRTTRSVVPTEAGQVYVEHARHALTELAEARDLATAAGGEPRGAVRMTAPYDLAGRFLAAPLARFAREHPAIQVELSFSSRTVDLVAERFDLALRAGRLGDSSLVGKRIAPSPLGIFASREYLAARGHPRRPADLARHDCVLFRGVQGKARWTLEGPKGSTTVEVTGPLSCDELGFSVEVAAAGAGVVLVPLVRAATQSPSAELVRVLPGYTVEGGGIYLLHPPTRFLPRRVALLRDFLHAELRRVLVACK